MDDRRRQLRRDMDRYLTVRRKTSEWFTSPKPLHPTIQTYKKEETMTEPSPTEGQMDKEYETTKKGWVSSFVDKLFGSEAEITKGDVENQLEPSADETTEDLKEISRISLHVMRQMPSEAISEFKTTPDYEKFKDILRKHKLIK